MWIMIVLAFICILYGIYYLYKDLKETCEKDMSRKERNTAAIIFALIIVGLPVIYFSGFLRSDKMIAGDDYILGRYPIEKFMQEYKNYEYRDTLYQKEVFNGRKGHNNRRTR